MRGAWGGKMLLNGLPLQLKGILGCKVLVRLWLRNKMTMRVLLVIVSRVESNRLGPRPRWLLRIRRRTRSWLEALRLGRLLQRLLLLTLLWRLRVWLLRVTVRAWDRVRLLPLWRKLLVVSGCKMR